MADCHPEKAAISVVVPTYRRPEELAELLESIATQSMMAEELLVVDDCSPEQHEYREVVLRFQDRIAGFRYLRFDRNQGAQAARNAGIASSRMDWIAFVDDDDLWMPRKIEAQWKAIVEADPGVGLVHSWADVFYPDGRREEVFRSTVRPDPLSALLRENYICSPTVVVRKAALETVGGFDSRFPSCQDWDAWVSILEAGFQEKVVEEVLALYRKHGRPSIGLSPNARLGYARFHRKHFGTALRRLDARFLARMIRFCLPA